MLTNGFYQVINNASNGHFEVDSKVQYACNFNETGQNRGYVIDGDSELVCNRSGSWSPNLPVCIKGSLMRNFCEFDYPSLASFKLNYASFVLLGADIDAADHRNQHPLRQRDGGVFNFDAVLQSRVKT